jgi:hypothetical protein
MTFFLHVQSHREHFLSGRSRRKRALMRPGLEKIALVINDRERQAGRFAPTEAASAASMAIAPPVAPGTKNETLGGILWAHRM